MMGWKESEDKLIWDKDLQIYNSISVEWSDPAGFLIWLIDTPHLQGNSVWGTILCIKKHNILDKST